MLSKYIDKTGAGAKRAGCKKRANQMQKESRTNIKRERSKYKERAEQI